MNTAIRHTPEEITTLITNSNKAVEHVLVAIYKRQTSTEREVEETRDNNKVGFTGAHAEFGTSLAKQIISNRYNKAEGQRLTVKQLPLARKMALHYIRQITLIANGELKEVD